MRITTPFQTEQAHSLAQTAKDFNICGLAIAVVAPGRKALMLHGATSSSGRAVNERSWFSVASVGKHFTATAVLELAMRKRLNLSKPIGHYLTDVPEAWAGRSILSLLRHSSGLPEYLSATLEEPVPDKRPSFMARYASLAPAFDEGAGWMYTNTNYILLGMLIAQVSGDNYADALQNLFKQVGCEGATVASPSWARQANENESHTISRDLDSARREVIGDGDVCLTPAGALIWLEQMIDGGLLDTQHQSLMFTAGPLATGRPSGYACGWFIEKMGDATIAHHGGHFDGWTAMAILNHSIGSGVLAMCNLAPGNTRAIRHLAQTALESFAPGSTPLSLAAITDTAPELTQRIRAQLLREPNSAPHPDYLADELRLVAEHGNPARSVPNLFAGEQPTGFDLVQRQVQENHTWHRYRLTYPNRIEHVLVGTSLDEKIFWAWPL